MKKITIIALHLGYGGIEKAISSLANMLCNDYEIEIISTYRLYAKPAFFIDDKVKVTYLMKEKPNRKEFYNAVKHFDVLSLVKEAYKGSKTLLFRRIRTIKAIKEINSDIIISTRPLHNEWVGKYGNEKAMKIAWEHSHHNNNKKYINNLLKSCINMDYLITVSKDLASFYKDKLSSKTKCLNMSLALDELPSKEASLENKEITSVGRLSKEKGYLDLVDVFEGVLQKYPDWHLNIVGDGLEKEKLLGKIKEKQLDESIMMHGFQHKDVVNSILKDTSIYAMTSHTESFGLVLIEAMAYGIPCLAFDSAQGATEIITDGEDGFLIKDRNKQEMINKMISLIEDIELRKKMGMKAREKALLFKPENVKKQWISILK